MTSADRVSDFLLSISQIHSATGENPLIDARGNIDCGLPHKVQASIEEDDRNFNARKSAKEVSDGRKSADEVSDFLLSVSQIHGATGKNPLIDARGKIDVHLPYKVRASIEEDNRHHDGRPAPHKSADEVSDALHSVGEMIFRQTGRNPLLDARGNVDPRIAAQLQGYREEDNRLKHGL